MTYPTKKLREICNIIKGKKPELYKKQSAHMLPYLGARFMRGSRDAEFALVNDKNAVAVSEKDLVIICDGSKSGDMFSGFEGVLSSTMGKMDFDEKDIEPSYLKKFLDLNFVLFNGAKKGAAIPHLDFNVFKNLEIPLPPIAEQKKIVEKIEKQFAKIDDAARLRAESWAATAALPPAALHEIFSSAESKGWVETCLADVANRFQYGSSKKSLTSGTVPCLRMGNLQDGKIDWSNLKYAPEDEDFEKFLLNDGDVLFNRTNSPDLVGKTAIFRAAMPSVFAGYLIRIDYKKEKILGEFLNYCLNSDFAKVFCRQVKTDGVSQSNINAKKLATFKIPLPPLAEQKGIVKKLDALSEKVRALRELQSAQSADLKALKQSILHEAFASETK